MPTHDGHIVSSTPSSAHRRARAGRVVAASALVVTHGLAACTAAESTEGTTVLAPSAVVRPGGPAAPAPSEDSGAAVLRQADALIATLSDEQRSHLIQPYTFANASRWHTYPEWALDGDQARIGLRLSTLSDEQWGAFDALLAAATGSGENEGYDEIQQHLAVDDYIGQNGGGDGYGRGNFTVAFLGEPSPTGIWQLQSGGHHLALNNTYRDGVLVGATPSFRAIEPYPAVDHNGATYAPQLQEWQAFVALLASLDADQAASAELADSHEVLVLGPEAENDWGFPAEAEGIAGSSLSDEQRALLMEVIRRYVDDVADVNAAPILAQYESELDDTHVSYSGSTSLTGTGDYVRIDGPSVWIELVMDPPYMADGPHVHAVWRDKRTDYGGTRP
jgi:hypothetical protein